MFESYPETQDLSWSQIQGDGHPVSPDFGDLMQSRFNNFEIYRDFSANEIPKSLNLL